jgi:hypothetical protein
VAHLEGSAKKMPASLKILLSLLAMYVPGLAVYIWAGRDFKKAPLKYYGIGFMVTGATTFLGAKFFGLAIAGRYSSHAVIGDDAVVVSLLIATLGILLFAAHYSAIKWFPVKYQAWLNKRNRRKLKPNRSVQTTPPPAPLSDL